VERKDHNPVTLEALRRWNLSDPTPHPRRQELHRRRAPDGALRQRADQLGARDAVNEQYADTYRTALSFAPRTPELLRTLGCAHAPGARSARRPVSAYQVDVGAAVGQALEGYVQDARRALAAANIPVKDVTTVAVGSERPNAVRVVLPPEADLNAARSALTSPSQG